MRKTAAPAKGRDVTDEQALYRRMRWRLVPYLLLLYVIAWLDRVNISFAALQMNADLGFSAQVYGFGAGIFFLGYALFEVPSNLILARVGARRWIARIMITWGLISVLMMFVQGKWSFYALRFALGVAEAGFLPGIIYYLSQWFPKAERARAVSWFMIGIPLSTVVGGPIAGVLLELDGCARAAGMAVAVPARRHAGGAAGLRLPGSCCRIRRATCAGCPPRRRSR